MSNILTSKNKIYFPGLNGLRFFAALAVIVTHVELFKKLWGFPNIWKKPIVFYAGSLGVDFFFVLSGFLITYLLLKEKERSGTINLKKFYMRRILKIWPLYYLIIILAFFILPKFSSLAIPYFTESLHNHFWEKLSLFWFFFPNLGNIAFDMPIPYAGMAWSIGVEEQFYLLWPLLIRSSRNAIKSIIAVIIAFLLVKVTILLAEILYGLPDYFGVIKEFLGGTRIEIMAIGGIGAHLLYHKSELLKLIYNKYIQLISYLLILPSIYYFPIPLLDGIHLYFAILFLIIILNISTNPATLFKLENSIFYFLGQISYGIYMYHMIVIGISIWLLTNIFKIPLAEDIYSHALLYILVIILTIFISFLSYYGFEKKFLKLKKKFTIIESGDDAK